MSEPKATTITQLLNSALEPDWLKQQSRECGVIQRQCKIEAQPLVWVLVMAFAHHKSFAIAAMHRTYNRRTAHNTSYSTFYDRFTPALTLLLKTCVDHVSARCKRLLPKPNHPLVQALSRLTAIDGTVIALHPKLAHLFPSTIDGQAKIKLHAVYYATHGLLDRFKFSNGLTHDRKMWKRVGPWVKGRLVLLDLGYWCFHLLWLIDSNNGWFLTRAKTGFNPLIVGVNGKVGGRSIDVVGLRLQEVLPRLKRRSIDLQVSVSFEKEARKGKRTTKTVVWRLVGLWNSELKQYHLYLTNISTEQMGVEMLGQLYRLRWQVELMFKALKSHVRADQLPSGKEDVVMVLLWAALLRFTLSRLVLMMVRQMAGLEAANMPQLRWQRLFEEMADELLIHLLEPLKEGLHEEHGLLPWAIHHAQDPNHRARDIALHLLTKLGPDGFDDS